MADDLALVAAELYGLPAEEFTAARDAVAKRADADLRRQVKALRRPTASAWLVNRLVRDQPDLLDRLLALGPALAEAQAAGRGADLRALGEERRELVQAVTAAAVEAAAREVSTAVRVEVERTLEAALADPAAAEAVRSGSLVRALSFAGFGGVDVEGAVAAAPTRAKSANEPANPPTRRKPRDEAAVARAERAALDAAARLDDAVRAAQGTERAHAAAVAALDTADRQRSAAQAEVDQLESRLAAAREELAAAGHRAHDAQGAAASAEQAVRRARRRVQQAQDEAERARAALDALRRR